MFVPAPHPTDLPVTEAGASVTAVRRRGNLVWNCIYATAVITFISRNGGTLLSGKKSEGFGIESQNMPSTPAGFDALRATETAWSCFAGFMSVFE